MKESGMEKLIELLNEYEKQFTDRPNYFWYKDKMLGKYIFCELNGRNIDNQELMIISERYEFIKWLVDYCKIDTQNLITYMNGTSLTFNKVPSTDCAGIEKTWNKFYTECLLMLLSIQDEPVKFLISLLK